MTTENEQDVSTEALLEQAEFEEAAATYGQEFSPFDEDDDE